VIDYLDREMMRNALIRMQIFHKEMNDLHKKFEISFLENLGRRNNIMSQSQENFIAHEIAKSFEGVVCDGRTGKADIRIESLDAELECKLTTRNRSGQISLQTDYETLKSKGSLDYIYVIASDDFNSFAALHFKGLTCDDFRVPSLGARGKSQMIKSKAMLKCKALMGEVINNNEIELDKLSARYSQTLKESDVRLGEIGNRLKESARKKESAMLQRMMTQESQRFDKKIKNILKKIDYWKISTTRFSIDLEKIS